MTTKEIRAIIEEQKAAAAKHAEQIAKLNSGMYAADYIKKETEKLNSAYVSAKTERGKKAANMLTAYKAQIRGTLDLADPALSNFIGLAQAMGKDLPKSVVDSAVEHFRGNNAALKAISSIAKNSGVEHTAFIDRFIVDETTLDEAILEAGRDFDRNSCLSPIGIALAHIDDVAAQEIIPEPIKPSTLPPLF